MSASLQSLVRCVLDARKTTDPTTAIRLYEHARTIIKPDIVLTDTQKHQLETILIQITSAVDQLKKKQSEETVRQIPQTTTSAPTDTPTTFTESAIPSTTFDDVAGLDDAKALITKQFTLRRLNKTEFKCRHILMYGSPGTGKTHLARAIANRFKGKFYAIDSAMLTDKYVGVSEKNVRDLFATAKKNAPSVIFVDEADQFFSARSQDGDDRSGVSVKSQLLIEFTELVNSDVDVVVIAATNRQDMFDSAFLRRFETKLYIPLPNAAARLYQLRRAFPHITDWEDVADRTDGYSGADIASITQTSKRICSDRLFDCDVYFRKVGDKYIQCEAHDENARQMTPEQLPDDSLAVDPPTLEHIIAAIDETKRSVSPETLQTYVEWTALFGQTG